MTFPRFLDCAYALLFEEYQRLGLDIVTVGERMEEWRKDRRRPDEAAASEVTKEEALARQNEQSLLELQAVMGSVGGMPG